MRTVEGIMIANKNCKTCFGKGYYAVKHDLTHKNTVSCNCLRPLVRESDIDEVVKILKKWVEYYESAVEKLKAALTTEKTYGGLSDEEYRKRIAETEDTNEQVMDETDERDSGDH